MRNIKGKNNPAWRPLEERFWEKVNKKGPTIRPELGPCWVWMGGTLGSGLYGTTFVNGKSALAHRTAWLLETGRWPTFNACHKCDNGLCVRFSHLFDGTNQENVDDRERKHRNKPPSGEHSGVAKLTYKKVQRIREELSRGKPQRQLGIKYGVSHTAIGRIKRGITWVEKERLWK
jgi:hypothetical protein